MIELKASALRLAIGAFAIVAFLVFPIFNLMIPPGHPLHLSVFWVTLAGKIMCYAIVALALDLAWGYAGILSLGHGLFFALGGYAMGMYLMRQIGGRGVYAHPILPDFMVFLNWTELPVYWYGFQSFPYAMLMVLLVPGALAFVFGASAAWRIQHIGQIETGRKIKAQFLQRVQFVGLLLEHGKQ